MTRQFYREKQGRNGHILNKIRHWHLKIVDLSAKFSLVFSIRKLRSSILVEKAIQ